MTAHLFSPFRQRDIEMRNRIAVSPMCMYSCEDGHANDWHLVHLGSLAVGGAGLVFGDSRGAQRIQEGGFSVVDMAHDSYHRWAGNLFAPLLLLLNDKLIMPQVRKTENTREADDIDDGP